MIYIGAGGVTDDTLVQGTGRLCGRNREGMPPPTLYAEHENLARIKSTLGAPCAPSCAFSTHAA